MLCIKKSFVPKFNRKIVVAVNINTLAHIYITDQFPGLIQAFLIKFGGAELVLWLQAFPLGEILHFCTP